MPIARRPSPTSPPPPAWPRARASTHGRRSPWRGHRRHRHPEPPLRHPKAPTEGAARSASPTLLRQPAMPAKGETTGQSSSRDLNTASLARRSSFESPREEPGAESPPPPSPAPRASTAAPPGATRAGRNWGREVAALGLGFRPLGRQEGATRWSRTNE
jgi:hypothetical protein